MNTCLSCKSKPIGNTGYCLLHLPEIKRCSAKTGKGLRCKLPRIEGMEVCKSHYNTVTRGYGAANTTFVYVYDTTLKVDGGQVYKIGRTANCQTRARTLGASNPSGRMLITAFVGKASKKIEAELHRKYLPKWLDRELFTLTNNDLADIKSYLEARSL